MWRGERVREASWNNVQNWGVALLNISIFVVVFPPSSLPPILPSLPRFSPSSCYIAIPYTLLCCVLSRFCAFLLFPKWIFPSRPRHSLAPFTLSLSLSGTENENFFLHATAEFESVCAVCCVLRWRVERENRWLIASWKIHTHTELCSALSAVLMVAWKVVVVVSTELVLLARSF